MLKRFVRGGEQKKMALSRGSAYHGTMTAEDLKALPIARKIQIMEALWEDLRDRFDRLELSQQQKELLDRRRARAKEGVVQLLDWEAVKGTIGRP